MMGLLSLPREVLLLVAERLSKRKYLLNLAQTCKSLYQLLEPKLFRHLTFEFDSDGKINVGLAEKFLSRDPLSREECYTRSIKISEPKRRFEDVEAGVRSWADHQKIKAITSAFPPNILTSLDCPISNLVRDISTIKRLIHNQRYSLRHLKISAPTVSSSLPQKQWDDLIDCLGIPTSLESLDFRRLENGPVGKNELVAVYNAIKETNTVKDLCLYKLCGTQSKVGGLSGKDTEITPQSLTRLTIYNCNHIKSFLETILNDNINLTQLKIKLDTYSDIEPLLSFIGSFSSLEELYLCVDCESYDKDHDYLNALLPHKQTLKYLGLHCIKPSDGEFPDEEPPDALSFDWEFGERHSGDIEYSLDEFPLLKEVSVCFFLEKNAIDDLFPQIKGHPSIEVLHLNVEIKASPLSGPLDSGTISLERMGFVVFRICDFMGENSGCLPKVSLIVANYGYWIRTSMAWQVQWRSVGAGRYKPKITAVDSPVSDWMVMKGYPVDKCHVTEFPPGQDNMHGMFPMGLDY